MSLLAFGYLRRTTRAAPAGSPLARRAAPAHPQPAAMFIERFRMSFLARTGRRQTTASLGASQSCCHPLGQVTPLPLIEFTFPGELPGELLLQPL